MLENNINQTNVDKNKTINNLKNKLKEFINQLNEEKEKNKLLNNEIERMNKYINETENEFAFIKREKGDYIDVIISEMNDDMEQYAIKTAKDAYHYNKNKNGIAVYIKEKFDSKYNRAWECIVGLSYSFYVEHNSNEYIYFRLGEYNVLLFRH